jgi:hypothetical protein
MIPQEKLSSIKNKIKYPLHQEINPKPTNLIKNKHINSILTNDNTQKLSIK